MQKSPLPGPLRGSVVIRLPVSPFHPPTPDRAITAAIPVTGRREVLVVQAYILIQTEVGKATAVAELISEIPGVLTAEDVTGPYDVIVKAEAETVDDLGRMVVAQVQKVEGITRTLTCPVVHL